MKVDRFKIGNGLYVIDSSSSPKSAISSKGVDNIFESIAKSFDPDKVRVLNKSDKSLKSE